MKATMPSTIHCTRVRKVKLAPRLAFALITNRSGEVRWAYRLLPGYDDGLVGSAVLPHHLVQIRTRSHNLHPHRGVA